jgi:LEA14-like dessication related protein
MRIFVRPVLFAAATFACAACVNLPGKMEPPSVTVSDVRMGTAGILEQQYFVKLRIQNPNDDDLQVKGASFELELNDQPFAKGVSARSVTVPRFASEFIEVETFSGISSILRQLGSMSSSGGVENFRYRIKGRLATRNAGAIPFDERGDLKLGGAGPVVK